jgi:hypothetical protein
MTIHQLLYVSGASRPLGDDDIDQILFASRRNNPRLGITGMLLAAGDAFIQVLEGEAAAVQGLAQRIRRDPRHRNFMVLVEQDAARRAFAHWDMGFKRLERDEAGDGAIFRITEQALRERIDDGDDGLMLDLVLAFGRDFMAAS